MTDAARRKAPRRERKPLRPAALLAAATWVQLVGFLRLIPTPGMTEQPLYLLFPALFVLVEWVHFAVAWKAGRTTQTVETAAFFLTGIGLWALAGVSPAALPEQLAACLLGLGLFHAVRWFMADVDRVRRGRVWLGLAAAAVLAVNLIFGRVISGSRNWIVIGPVSVQPSEFVKMVFVLTGATTLDRLQGSRHVTWFLLFFAVCMGSLALMGDFGTACVFFVTFLLMSFLRSGRLLTLIMMCGGAVGAAAALLISKPYIARRFEAWRRVWEFSTTSGYQQTRLLIALASGGLLGLGPGQGLLKRVAAATTDLMFGVVCEEWGLLMALVAVAVYAGLVVLAVRLAPAAGSSLYVIAGIGAAGLLLFQAGLNIFGVTDLLPLTGITLPFISRGGSSMAACWGLVGFIAALEDSGRREVRRVGDFVVHIPELEAEEKAERKAQKKAAKKKKKKPAAKAAPNKAASRAKGGRA